ncbi:MAG: DUF2141 domain-containing protein [Stenotrophobium sp.]
MSHLKNIIATAVLCISALAASAAHAGSLDVHLSHLRPCGTLRLSVYANVKDWKAGRPQFTRVVAVKGFSQTVLIDNLKPGRYALRAEQDADWYQLAPALAFARRGYSGDASANGFPSFEQAAVTVDAGDPDVSLRLNISDRDD